MEIYVWPNEIVDAVNKLIAPANDYGCRFWIGWKDTQGYGTFSPIKGVIWKAHKLVLCIKTNRFYVHPSLMDVWLEAAHDCPGGDNKLCVEHVRWMTKEEHTTDKISKKQMLNGIKNIHAKIESDEVALQIYHSPKSALELAKIFNVDRRSIRNIKIKRTWKHLWH
jgi:hypothetical protein